MAGNQGQLELPTPTTWTPPKGKHACGRDPSKGPGTCWHWWDLCPRPEKRGCYELWKDKMRAALKAEARS